MYSQHKEQSKKMSIDETDSLGAFLSFFSTFYLLYAFQTYLSFWHIYIPKGALFFLLLSNLVAFILSYAGQAPSSSFNEIHFWRRQSLILLFVISIVVVHFWNFSIPLIIAQIMLSSWLVIPDILVLFYRFKKLITPKNDSEKLKNPHKNSKFQIFSILFIVFVPFFLHSYLGLLGASVGLCTFWALRESVLFFKKSSFHNQKRTRLMFVILLPLFSFIVWMKLIYPLPIPLYGHEILYTKRVAGEATTVNARKNDKDIYYSVNIPKFLIYQTTNAYRYAEMMVHPAFALSSKKPQKILLVGGENGHILEEINKYNSKKRALSVFWLDLFPQWTRFFHTSPIFAQLNAKHINELEWQRVILPDTINSHTFQKLLVTRHQHYDLIFADFPAPRQKNRMLFQKQTLITLARSLSLKGIMSIHLGSPYTQKALYWCLISLFARHKFHVIPYQLSPALFQDYGFAMISKKPISLNTQMLNIPVKTRYLYKKQPFHIFRRFSKETSPNKLDMTPDCLLSHQNLLE